MRRATLLVVVALGCSGPRDAPHDAAPADAAPLLDAGPPTVSGRFVEVVTGNTADLPPRGAAETLALDPARVVLTVQRDGDATASPVALSTTGLFAFPLAHAGQGYHLTFVLDGAAPTTIQSSAPSLELRASTLERHDVVRITKPTPITFDAGSAATSQTDFVVVDSTGLRSQSSPTLTGGTKMSLDFAKASRFGTRGGLLDEAHHDQLVITRWRPTGGTSADYVMLVGADTRSVTMTDGATLDLGAVTFAPPPGGCLNIVAPRANELARIERVLPGTYAGYSDSWILTSPAAPGFGANGGLELAVQLESGSGAVAGTNADDRSVVFRDPFADDHLLLEMTANLAIRAGVGVGTSTFRELPRPAAGDCPTVDLTPAVAIPTITSVAGAALAPDAVIALDRSAPVPVTWAAHEGRADSWQIQLLTADPVGVVATVLVADPATTVTFDPALFHPGVGYAIQVLARIGNAQAAAGDFAALTFPLEVASSFSSTFTVTPVSARALVAGPLLAGCSIVYGADEPIDAHVVHGRYSRQYVTASLAVAEETFATSKIQVTAILDDGTSAPVTYDDDGRFELARASDDQPYALSVERNGGLTEYQLTQPEPRLVEHDVGRPDLVPVTQPTRIHFDTTIELPQDYVVLSTGVWSQTAVPRTAAPFTFDWRTAAFDSASGLLDAHAGDALYLAQMTPSSGATPYTAVTSALAAQVTLTDGGDVHVTGTPSASPPACVTVNAPHVADRARLAQLVPGMAAYGQDAHVRAAPTLAEGFLGSTTLAVATSATPHDEQIAMSFMNPLPGTTLVADVGTGMLGDISLAGAKPALIPSGTRYASAVPAAGACPVTAPVVGPVGLARAATLAGVGLDPDLSPDPIAVAATRGAPSVLTWTSDTPVDVWVAQLFAVSTTGGQTTLTEITRIVSTEPHVELHPGTLVAGQAYVIRFDGTVGFPAAIATADFTNLVYPIAAATSWTHLFQVTP